jgi:hypothetical protein
MTRFRYQNFAGWVWLIALIMLAGFVLYHLITPATKGMGW